MSDDKQRKLFPAWRAVAAAVVAGAVAGGIGVYVSGGVAGNTTAAQDVVAVEDAGNACAAKAERAQAIAQAATGEVAALLPADPPVSLTALTFNDPAGAPMSIADRAGKTVLLNLWATWCAPCRAEMPALDTLQKEAGGDAFEVVAVNVDSGDDTKPNAFLEEIGIASLARYRDPTLGIFNELKKRGLALGLPVTLLIDEKGCLLAHMNGPAEWSSSDARRVVAAATATP
jgi:thiol-disulfide isomerase/thioredoxin